MNGATTENNELIAYHGNNEMESKDGINQPITSPEKNNKAERPGDLQNAVETTRNISRVFQLKEKH